MCKAIGSVTVRDLNVYAAEVPGIDGVSHALGFQCMIDTLEAPGPTALIIPVPAVQGGFTEKDLVSTDTAPDIMDEIVKAAISAPRGRVGVHIVEMPTRYSKSQAVIAPAGRIFAVSHISEIAAAIKTLPPHQRPKVGQAELRALAAAYRGWGAVLWCFFGPCRARTEPLLLKYKPLYPQTLYAPAPLGDGNEWSRTEVRLAVGSCFSQDGAIVRVRHATEEMAALIGGRVIGDVTNELSAGGDFVCSLTDVRSGVFSPKRVLSPGTVSKNEKALR